MFEFLAFLGDNPPPLHKKNTYANQLWNYFWGNSDNFGSSIAV